LKAREPRQSVIIPARMRTDAKWVDVKIRNVSAHGLMMEATTPPKRGAFIEIRKGTSVIIVGQVRWSGDRHFGVRSQDRISLDLLTNEHAAAVARAAANDKNADRRSAKRSADRPQDVAARSRRVSSAIQFGFIVLMAGGAALFAASEVRSLLSRPVEAVNRALATR
jgi:hypothetical protein